MMTCLKELGVTIITNTLCFTVTVLLHTIQNIATHQINKLKTNWNAPHCSVGGMKKLQKSQNTSNTVKMLLLHANNVVQQGSKNGNSIQAWGLLSTSSKRLLVLQKGGICKRHLSTWIDWVSLEKSGISKQVWFGYLSWQIRDSCKRSLSSQVIARYFAIASHQTLAIIAMVFEM